MEPATSSDPIRLFSEELQPEPPAADGSIVDTTSRPAERKIVSVAVPHMSNEDKEKYTDLKLDVRGIVGDYQEGSRLYYYALLADGMYHKLRAMTVKKEYPELVETYESKKEHGSIPPFDPSGKDVHPSSRIRLSITLNTNRVNASAYKRSLKTLPNNPDDADSESQSDEDAAEASDYGDDGTPVKPHRSSRSSSAPKKKQTRLPFSPKKTRAAKRLIVYNSDDEGDESEVQEIVAPSRRSTRTTTRAPIIDNDYMDEDDDEEDDEDDEDDYGGPSARSKEKPKKKVVRGKASRPAYGNFRTIADLDFDPCSDEETAPLRAHREECEKCHKGQTNILLMKQSKKAKPKAKRRRDEDEEDVDEGEKITALGGWVRCLKCPVTLHWKCLSAAQRTEIIKAALDRDIGEFDEQHPPKEDPEQEKIRSAKRPGKRPGLDAYQTTEFICNYCIKGGICMGCEEVALKPDAPPQPVADKDGDIEMSDAKEPPAQESSKNSIVRELLFRCLTCKRLAHYAHLPEPSDLDEEIQLDAVDLARHYQDNDWICGDCSSYTYPVDKILAWRPYPPNATETSDSPNYKDQLPREYLVKWQGRSYRRTQWVPHMWLLSTHMGKLSNFVQGKGPKIDLLKEPVKDGEDVRMETAPTGGAEGDAPPIAFGDIEEPSTSMTPPADSESPSGANPDADRKIPPTWKTIDRVLDLLLWAPKKKQKKKSRLVRAGSDPEDLAEVDEEAEATRLAVFEEGEQPSDDYTADLATWERRNNRELNEDDIGLVIWTFAKWKDLNYDESSWDSPPRPGDPEYSSFEYAFKRFLFSREVHVPKMNKKEAQAFDKRPKGEYKSKYLLEGTPDLGQSDKLALMPFQVDGVNWLCNNWWIHQHCILADEMGLGKTVQIVAFIGIISSKFNAHPCLVVVPNSTIPNWVREFERWAPQLRVVPYYGEAKSREIIRKYELSHNTSDKTTTGAKYHVLITTYETLTNPKEFGMVFNSTPRWETLVVDEGQRLKSDHSLIFKKLNELNTIHRIILTGTPLNNNIRELFNLMNFLDPEEWNGLREMEKEHEVLTEELVKQLHGRLRPYFLRRIKSEVLDLPPKNEVIVPVSMTPLQKEVYRSILSQNLEILKSLTQPADAKANRAITRTNMNNMLMQLRKCLQHPYLVSTEIEPKGLSPLEAHGKLIDASAKLLLLKTMLPKLKARGHRVLLFSQFKMVLDVIEDFLDGEGVKHLRLDGDTPSAERQKGIDEYNREGSDIFVYLLTTRAGGVGINLYTANTVIIFDPDFNPHQDLQAIARAHRYGIKKTCLVFKLMVKNSAEDRIMQMGKKKLALEHVIVQKMDEDGPGEDVQSILTFGARELFEEGENNRSTVYSDGDVQSLIEKTEKEGDEVAEHGPSATFSFAKIWAADKDGTEEMTDVTTESAEQGDSWAQTLQRIANDREKVQAKEVTGRGAKRKAAAYFANQQKSVEDVDSPDKKSMKKSKKSTATVDSEDSEGYQGSVHEDVEGDDTDATGSIAPDDLADVLNKTTLLPSGLAAKPVAAHGLPLSAIQNNELAGACALCGSVHKAGACYFTENSKNLAAFRLLLITEVGSESIHIRRAAIQAIDETLMKRGDLSVIHGQPLHILDTLSSTRKKSRKGKAPDIGLGVAGPSRDHAVSSSSKRPLSSSPASSIKEPAPKKPKTIPTTPTICPVCAKSSHLISDCPIVLQGPTSVVAAMRQLQAGPATTIATSALSDLKRILKQQKKALETTS